MSKPSESLKPLSGRTVLIAGSAKKMPELTAGIEAMGGAALAFHAIETRELEQTEILDKALASLQQYSWIIFTSVHGVAFFMRRMKRIEADRGCLKMPAICAIGPATAAAVQEYGLETRLIAETYIAEGVIEALAKYHGGLQALSGLRVLIPRALEAREILPEALLAAGVLVDVAPCYETIRTAPAESLIARIRNRHPDLMIFISSSGVRSFIECFGEEYGRVLLTKSAVAVIGPVTGSTAGAYGKSAEIIPEQNTIVSLLEAIRGYYICRPTTVCDPQ